MSLLPIYPKRCTNEQNVFLVIFEDRDLDYRSFSKAVDTGWVRGEEAIGVCVGVCVCVCGCW